MADTDPWAITYKEREEATRELLVDCRAIMDRKAAEYAETDRVFSNYEEEGVGYMLGRAHEKMHRLKRLTYPDARGVVRASQEDFLEEVMDIINMMAMAGVMLRRVEDPEDVL